MPEIYKIFWLLIVLCVFFIGGGLGYEDGFKQGELIERKLT
jgi:hypothetical protein